MSRCISYKPGCSNGGKIGTRSSGSGSGENIAKSRVFKCRYNEGESQVGAKSDPLNLTETLNSTRSSEPGRATTGSTEPFPLARLSGTLELWITAVQDSSASGTGYIFTCTSHVTRFLTAATELLINFRNRNARSGTERC